MNFSKICDWNLNRTSPLPPTALPRVPREVQFWTFPPPLLLVLLFLLPPPPHFSPSLLHLTEYFTPTKHTQWAFMITMFFCFVHCLFQAFLLVVIGLTTSVVVIYYAYLLPVIREYSTPWVVFHLITAHWLLINIVFHYFKVVFTSPGLAPQVIDIIINFNSREQNENFPFGFYTFPCK